MFELDSTPFIICIINKIYFKLFSYLLFCGFSSTLFPLAIVLLGIPYLIDFHTSNGQHKEPQRECGEQRREQQCYQPITATSANS
jgi:hypothetical protein